MSSVARNLASVLAKIKDVVATHSVKVPVRLCAVSKTKPVEALKLAYDEGQRHFGENYVQELVTKAPLMPDDVQWHFIGNLQSNKCKFVAGIKNLALVETVDKPSLAKALNKACVKVGRPDPLNVLVQVRALPVPKKSRWTPTAVPNTTTPRCECQRKSANWLAFGFLAGATP